MHEMTNKMATLPNFCSIELVMFWHLGARASTGR